jgi:hypothetical protein
MPTQCLLVGAALYLASKFTAKAISGLVRFARYMSDPMTLRYGTSYSKTFLSSLLSLNGSFSSSSDLTTIEIFKGTSL